MAKPPRLKLFSHPLLHYRTGRWRIGYLAAPTRRRGIIRVSRAVAEQICRDIAQLRTDAIGAALAHVHDYEQALAVVDATLPRLHLDGVRLVADWRHVEADSDALRSTEPDADGWYTISLGLAWRPVAAGRCDAVRDDSTLPSPTAVKYQAYVGCFADPTMALLDLAARAGIAVAYLDRGAIEADTDRALTDDEWERITCRLDWYDEHVSGSGDLTAAFLDQVFAAAGVERYTDTDNTNVASADTDDT